MNCIMQGTGAFAEPSKEVRPRPNTGSENVKAGAEPGKGPFAIQCGEDVAEEECSKERRCDGDGEVCNFMPIEFRGGEAYLAVEGRIGRAVRECGWVWTTRAGRLVKLPRDVYVCEI